MEKLGVLPGTWVPPLLLLHLLLSPAILRLPLPHLPLRHLPMSPRTHPLPPPSSSQEKRLRRASRNLLKPFGHEGSRRDENVLKFMNQLPSLANTDPIRFALCCREDASPRARLGGFATQIHGLRGVAVSSGGVAMELTARS